MGKLRQVTFFNQIGRGKHYRNIRSFMGITIFVLLIPVWCVGWALYYVGGLCHR